MDKSLDQSSDQLVRRINALKVCSTLIGAIHVSSAAAATATTERLSLFAVEGTSQVEDRPIPLGADGRITGGRHHMDLEDQKQRSFRQVKSKVHGVSGCGPER